MHELQKLFAWVTFLFFTKKYKKHVKNDKKFTIKYSLMELSDQKYVDPSALLSRVIGRNGKPVQIGDQGDDLQLYLQRC